MPKLLLTTLSILGLALAGAASAAGQGQEQTQRTGDVPATEAEVEARTTVLGPSYRSFEQAGDVGVSAPVTAAGMGPEEVMGREVVDQSGTKVGTVHDLLLDAMPVGVDPVRAPQRRERQAVRAGVLLALRVADLGAGRGLPESGVHQGGDARRPVLGQARRAHLVRREAALGRHRGGCGADAGRAGVVVVWAMTGEGHICIRE